MREPVTQAVARRFDSNGAPLGDEFPVNVFTTGDQIPSGIAMSPAGFVVTWFGEGPGGEGLFGRRFDASGAPITGDFQVNTATLGTNNARPDVGMNAAGDFVVVWDDVVGFYQATTGRRFHSGGVPLGDVFPISGTSLAAFDPQSRLRFRRKFRRDVDQRGRGARSGADDPGAVRARLFDIGGVRRQPGIRGQRDHGRLSVSRPPFARGRRLVRRRLEQRNGHRRRRQRPQERRAGGAGDRDRPERDAGLLAERGPRQRRLRARRNAGPADRLGQRHRCRRWLRVRVGPTLHRTSGRRLHDQRRRGAVRHDPGRADQELHRRGGLLLGHRVGSGGEARPALGRPAAGDLQPQPAAHLGAPPRRELPRRSDRPPVLCLHRDALPQRRHRRLRRRRLLPRQPRHPRPDGRLSPEVQVRLRPTSRPRAPEPSSPTCPARAARSIPGSKSSRLSRSPADAAAASTVRTTP